MMTFLTPSIGLEPNLTTGVRTLPELVEFHTKNNAQHMFCLQAEKKTSSSGNEFVSVNYERLQHAIFRCQAWLGDHAPELHPPIRGTGGETKKCAPVAILMESDFSLAVYVLTLMGLGIPAVMLSSRLSPLAVRHLIRATGAKLALVSQRLHPLILEAFPPGGDGSPASILSGEVLDDQQDLAVCLAAGYEFFLADEQVTSTGVAHHDHYIAEDDRQVVILHSSGSSGLPKPIYCSHRYFLGFTTCHDFSSDMEAQGLTISTSPFFHVRFLIAIVQT
jgi:acyl-CoA synthetase (AMP-forming)/AMP-acid ligase II